MELPEIPALPCTGPEGEMFATEWKAWVIRGPHGELLCRSSDGVDGPVLFRTEGRAHDLVDFLPEGWLPVRVTVSIDPGKGKKP